LADFEEKIDANEFVRETIEHELRELEGVVKEENFGIWPASRRCHPRRAVAGTAT
jgi:hypothetical protein